MNLAVVVVNWNTRELLARCLRSVQDSLAQASVSWQIVVVDSASDDGSAEMVREDFSGVSLLELAENRGFGAGANRGLQALLPASPCLRVPASFSPGAETWGHGDTETAVLLLNADTEITGAAIHDMVAYLDAHPDVGVVGPQLRYPDGVLQPSRRRFPTLGTLLWESTVLELYWPGNPWARRYHVADQPDTVEQPVDWLVGACLLVRMEAITAAGLFDEGYFLYFEELEWCQRVQEAGWRVVYLPTAHVTHYEGRSTEQVPLQRHLYFGWSKVRYARKACGAGWAEFLRCFLLATFAWQWLVEGAKWLVGHKRKMRRERMEIYAAVLRNGLKRET